MPSTVPRSSWNISICFQLALTYPNLSVSATNNTTGRSLHTCTSSMKSIMGHSPDAWEHLQFKDVASKVANVEVYYKAIHFYLQEHPELLNDLLAVLASRVDHSRVVDIMRKVELNSFTSLVLLSLLHLQFICNPYLSNV
jgi:hypothetical protein